MFATITVGGLVARLKTMLEAGDPVACAACRGTGAANRAGFFPTPCDACGGVGKISNGAAPPLSAPVVVRDGDGGAPMALRQVTLERHEDGTATLWLDVEED